MKNKSMIKFGLLLPIPHTLHGILGSPSILLILSPLIAFITWKTEIIPNIKSASFIIVLFMMLGFLVFIPNVFPDYFGVKQRIFHLSWTVWFMYLTVVFIRLNNRNCI